MSPNGRTQVHEFTSTAATRAAIWIRFFLCGAGGSGKTYSALAIACALAERLDAGPVHVIDSEHGSALRYAKSAKSGRGFDFIHTPMPDGDYSPATYERALAHVVNAGARIILVDSISHEWDGANGCLEQVDRIADAAERSGKKHDNFSAWRTVTPMHKHWLEAVLSLPAHVFCTIRAKTKYESRRDERTGRMKFEEVGEGPVQREGIKYEPDLFGWCSDATMTIDKTRCDRIDPGSVWLKPGADVATLLADWIQDSDAPLPAQVPANDPPAPVGPSPKARALAFVARIRDATTAADLLAIVADVEKDPHDLVRADMLTLAEKRRAEIAGGVSGAAAGGGA